MRFQVNVIMSVLFLLIFTSLAVAGSEPGVSPGRHGLSLEQKQLAAKHNQRVARQLKRNRVEQTVLRPFADYEHVGTLVMNSGGDFGSLEAKQQILRHLPKDVSVVMTAPPAMAEDVKTAYASFIEPNRLSVLGLTGMSWVGFQGGNGFWARDSFPLPVYIDNNGAPATALVNAKYGLYAFEPDAQIGRFLRQPILSHSYVFEGGNFQADAKGNCLAVNTWEVQAMPDSIFRLVYGCHTLTRLPESWGIGHVDERIRIVSDNLALTDHDGYRPFLEKLGFQVRMLPKAEKDKETYANSLLVNGTVFLPVFNEASDKEAISIYQDLGFTVVPLNSVTLSNEGWGSLHCIAMTYPRLVR